MMSYLFFPSLLLRRPVRGPGEYTLNIDKMLSDAHFLAALVLATPVFYESLRNLSFRVAALSEKEKQTLTKYFNRFCFRPTPFGLFSSVTLMNWSEQEEPVSLSEPVFEAIVRASQTYQYRLASSLLQTAIPPDQLRFEANFSLYRVMKEYRFFHSILDENGQERQYLLQSIEFSTLLKTLIAFCRSARSRSAIIDQIESTAGCSPEEAAEYADFLIDSQLLVNRFRPNITGTDYLSYLTGFLSSRQRDERPDASVHFLRQLIAHHPIDANHFRKLTDRLNSLLSGKRNKKPATGLSVILKRRAQGETLHKRHQLALRDGLYALDALSSQEQHPAMNQFIQSFQQHFEGQSLPLLTALDPEVGIGYHFPGPGNGNPLLETLHLPPYLSSQDTALQWRSVHSFLLDKWHQATDRTIITLTTEELKRFKSTDLPLQTIGMSLLFRTVNDKIYMENAGGVNAPALIGRFTISDDHILGAAREMAKQEEQQNPDVIFAELIHLADPHSDNINRRGVIWSYELPITAASLVPADNQLQMSDLYICASDNKIMLYSAKHNKIVIPRLTSAYNHSLNQLPLFRFLADLPYQYCRHNLSLDLRRYFPGLSFYPRVEYRSVILCLATWIIHEEQIKMLLLPDPDAVVKKFQEIMTAIKLPLHFSLAEGDQHLVFDVTNNAEILFFVSCIRQKKQVTLQEFLEKGPIRQYNACILPVTPISTLLPQVAKTVKKTAQKVVRRKFAPGSDWLYLKIYSPRTGTDGLLLKMQGILRKRYRHGRVFQWFFIRYEDHAPHIRLRLKIIPDDIGEILMAFNARLQDHIQQQVIREYQIDVYSRELERYAAAGIDHTEHFFWASSELVIRFIQIRTSHGQPASYLFALYTLRSMLSVFIQDRQEQLLFTLHGYQQFLPEFESRSIRVDLDKKYRELSEEIRASLLQKDGAMLSGSVKAGKRFTNALKRLQKVLVTDPEIRNGYLRSIFHMHLNRIFMDESRKQEMITYYLLYKFINAQIKQGKATNYNQKKRKS